MTYSYHPSFVIQLLRCLLNPSMLCCICAVIAAVPFPKIALCFLCVLLLNLSNFSGTGAAIATLAVAYPISCKPKALAATPARSRQKPARTHDPQLCLFFPPYDCGMQVCVTHCVTYQPARTHSITYEPARTDDK